VTTFSGHTDWVASLVFSQHGTSLVSGGNDMTIKLWDMQTGGVVKTFQGQNQWVASVSISADCTTIASGSGPGTIHLWDIQTGECYCTIEQKRIVDYVYFSPLNPKHLMSVSGGKVWQWDIGGQQIAPEYDGSHIVFSLDGTCFAVSNGSAIEVKSTDSKEIVAKFCVAGKYPRCFCFSPDNKIIAMVLDSIVHIWDITSSDPYLLETFMGHSEYMTSLAFSSPSSLISTSRDRSVKFWQIGVSSTNLAPADPESAPHTLAQIKSITLQAKDGVAISSHSDGVVKIWDISTGLCKTSFQTPAKDPHLIDTQLTDGKLISVWCIHGEIHIWDTEERKLLRTVTVPEDVSRDPSIVIDSVRDLRISDDGSRVLCLLYHSIQVLSIWTGEVLGKVGHESSLSVDPFLTSDGPRVWIHFPSSPEPIKGWDFGILGSSPAKLSNVSQNRPHLDFIGGLRKQRSFLPGIQNTVTRKVVFQLPGRLERPSDAQWDGQYLVAGYNSGEVLILECNCT